MATLYKTDGTEAEVTPKNGKDFKLAELNEFVEGFIEIVRLRGGKILVINEEGKLEGLKLNAKATELYQQAHGPVDVIVGNALYCDTGQVT